MPRPSRHPADQPKPVQKTTQQAVKRRLRQPARPG
ncbi:hypothetical protein Ae505Ps2_6324 [Pseudonocardia sp. Ae505_Ps2]|nr:hypothetical protein Ae505Ps2_6324 [Pseudonocardia sp. Ae505_Ps2]